MATNNGAAQNPEESTAKVRSIVASGAALSRISVRSKPVSSSLVHATVSR